MTTSRALVVHQLKTFRGQVLLAAALGVLALGAAPGEETSPVRRFILRSHSHGIHLEDARKLGSEAFPELATILREEEAKPYWVNAAVVMGLVGHPAALDTLRRFVWDRFRGPVDGVTFRAMIGWQSALAVGSRPRDKRIFQFLSAGSDPAYWDSLPWTYPEMSRSKRNQYLSRLCTIALGNLPGAEVERLLRQIERKPHFPLQRIDARAALKANAGVTKLGIERYLKQQQSRATLGDRVRQ